MQRSQNPFHLVEKDFLFLIVSKYKFSMAKLGSAKNTKNKAKHSKLMDKKKIKLRQEKIARKERLKTIIALSKKDSENK